MDDPRFAFLQQPFLLNLVNLSSKECCHVYIVVGRFTPSSGQSVKCPLVTGLVTIFVRLSVHSWITIGPCVTSRGDNMISENLKCLWVCSFEMTTVKYSVIITSSQNLFYCCSFIPWYLLLFHLLINIFTIVKTLNNIWMCFRSAICTIFASTAEQSGKNVVYKL